MSPFDRYRLFVRYSRELLGLCAALSYPVDEMPLQLEREERADLEQRVEQLETTVRALARERTGTTLGGPCSNCGKCLTFKRADRIHCPHCGDGQPM